MMELIEDSTELIAEEGILSPPNGSTKPAPPHVPPRIDPDMYQADVPDWCPPKEESASDLPDSGLHSKSVYSAEYSSSPEVQEFLTAVRNLLDPVRPKGQQFWAAPQSAVPLETDVIALEYLSSYNYDVEKAMFNLYCELGRGKDAVFTGKTVAMTERTASNVIFSDCKDRLLRVPPHAMFGAYYAAFNQGRLPSAEPLPSANISTPSSHLSSAAIAAATAFGGAVADLASILTTGHTSHHQDATHSALQAGMNGVSSSQQRVIFSSIISHPMQQADCERLLSAASRLSSSGEILPLTGDAGGAEAEKLHRGKLLSAAGKKKEPKGKSNAVAEERASVSTPTADLLTLTTTTTSSGVGSGGEEDEEVQPVQRLSKPRGASSDKVELRKKWLQVAQKASALLHRGTLTAAQAVLEQACALPPYSNNVFSGSAVVNSTSAANMSNAAVAAAQEEAALLDNVGTILGKLVKATVAARFWVSEVRDAVYCCSLDALIHTGQNDVRNKSKKGNAESLMNGLRELLKESEALQVYAEPEERQLRQTVEATGKLLEQTRRILRECCAWERNASSTDALIKFESTAVTASATHKHTRVVRGRPEVYSAATVRSLLLAYIHQGTETFDASSVEKRPSMEEVGELLVLAAKNPVKISEMAYLEDLHRRGLQLVDTASTILVRAAQLSVAKSRLTLDRVRYTIAEVQGLLRSMHSFPFRSREVDALQALVRRAEAWRKEVVAMSGGVLSNDTDAPSNASTNAAADGSKNNRSNASRRSDASLASAANNKPIPLKKVEALIAEGERFPFEFKNELEVLRDKKDLAKLWLEKLKRSFVPTKVNSGRSKKGSDDAAAAGKAEKLSLSDMKLMVSEGESLYQQPLEEDADLSAFSSTVGAAPASLLGRPAASSRTVNRELDRALAVVETAEDWISRVRDLLAGGDEDGSESSARGISPAEGEGPEGALNGEEGHVSEEESEDEEDSPERTIQILRAMLQEAESMPVTLDECGLLRCHLQALEWAAKVRPLLNIPTTVSTTPGTGEMMEEENAAPVAEDGGEMGEEKPLPASASGKRSRDNKTGAGKQQRAPGKPRLAEMQQFAKEISRIRASAGSASSSSDIPLKPLPEEIRCLSLVADAEKWLNKAKKLMQGNTVRRGTKLSRVRLLHDEGTQLPIHFEAELRPLKIAIAAAEQWAAQHRAVLEALGITDTDLTEPSEMAVEGNEEQESDRMHVVKAESATGAVSNGDAPAVESVSAPVLATVSYNDFAKIVAAASQLVVDFSLVRSVQMLNAEVERWMLKVHKVCGTEPSVIPSVSSSTHNNTGTEEEGEGSAETAAAHARSTKRRKLADAGEGTSESMPEGPATDSATPSANATSVNPSVNPSTTSATAPSANHKITAMISLAQLDSLIEEGQHFRLDLSEQLQQLAQVKINAEAWERSAVQYISLHFSESLKKVFIDYKRLTTDYTTPENGSIFPFMRRKPSALSSHSIAKGYKEESMGYGKLQALLNEVINVRIVGERIGVEMPFHRTILVYIRLLEWIQEARNVACFLAASRRPSAALHASAKKNVVIESYGGWEDLKEPIVVKNWGDVSETYVLALISEGAAMLAQLYQLEADERLPSILIHYSRGLLGSVKEYDELIAKEAAQAQENLKPDVEEEEEGNGEEDQSAMSGDDEGEEHDADREREGEESDIDNDHGEADNTTTTNKSDKKKRTSDAASRKRKSTVPMESSIQGPKSTRAASGITKKKVDADFAETVNLQHFNAQSSAHDGSKHNPHKRQKTATSATSSRAAAGKTDDITPAQSNMPVEISSSEAPKLPAVDLDLLKTARRAGAAAFLDSSEAKSAKLSPSMAHFLDMWVRILKVFALRLRLAKAWAAEAQRLVGGLSLSTTSDTPSLLETENHSSTSSTTVVAASVKAGSEEEIERLLAAAQEASIQVHQRTVLESAVLYSKEWLQRAENLQLMTMDEQKLFLKAGEKVIYVQKRNTIATDLRTELKKAKNWKMRFDKSGFDSGNAPAELLTELVDEAKMIRMNLTEYTDNIVQVNKTYCLCRLPYHGQMVGCDTCEEWYHFQCVGLSFSQAEKCAKYVCVRCQLKNSFNHSANLVAQLTNKWMNCAEHFRRRDEAFQKISKKLYKEEKEYLKAKAILKSAIDAIPASSLTPELTAALNAVAGDIPADMTSIQVTKASAENDSGVSGGSDMVNSASSEIEGGTELSNGSVSTSVAAHPAPSSTATSATTATTAAPATATLPTSTAERVLNAKREVMQLASNVAKSAQEKEKLFQAIQVETHLHREIFRWMSAMQELLWPGSDEQKAALGRPVGPAPQQQSQASLSVLEYNRAILGYLPALLPVGLVHMEKAAALVGIQTLDDVALALDAFRWMSWTNLCLHLLRNAPTTAALRKLLDGARGLTMADDKITKLLAGVLQRAVAWKVKARKILTPQSKKLDLTRLQSLAIEGAGLPFTSRLKEKLKLILAASPVAALTSPDGAADSSTSSATKGAKRGPKPTGDASGGFNAATGEPWSARVAASGVEDCVSSDEEDAHERQVYAHHQTQAQAQAQEAEGSMEVPFVSSAYTHDYQPCSAQTMAAVPDLTWPAQLLVMRRKPVGAVAPNTAGAAPNSSSSGSGNVTSGAAVATTALPATESVTAAIPAASVSST